MDLLLTIPDDMVPDVDAAVRATYGGLLTVDMDTATAMHAVARFWLGSLMADYAAGQARAAGDVQVQGAVAARDQSVQGAADAARAQVEAIPWPDTAPAAAAARKRAGRR